MAYGTDHAKFHEHKEIIANTDGLYWIGAGDYKDNYKPTMPFGNNEQLASPSMQDLMVHREYEGVRHNCIALVRASKLMVE